MTIDTRVKFWGDLSSNEHTIIDAEDISMLTDEDLMALICVSLREKRYRHEWLHSRDGDVGDALERQTLLAWFLTLHTQVFPNHSINGLAVFFMPESGRTAGGDLWAKATSRTDSSPEKQRLLKGGE